MSDLRELYQSTILDHNKKPRNFRAMDHASHHADGYNPLCGDKVSVWLDVRDGVIRDVSFQGSGCAISTASASMLTESVKGKPVAEADALYRRFHDAVTGPIGEEPSDEALDALGKLAVFVGVREYPARVKCATLVWHALRAALAGGAEPVSTESPQGDAMSDDTPTPESAAPPAPAASDAAPASPSDALRERVLDVLRGCFDPEIPVNIYELGLVYDVDVSDDGEVAIRMTLTSPMCPVAGSLPPEVEEKVRALDGVRSATVEVVWDPPWNPGMMSEAARLELNMF